MSTDLTSTVPTSSGIKTEEPLRGKRVLITRPKEQSVEFIHLLESQGAVPVLFPTIEIVPVKRWHSVDDTLKRIYQYDWLVFASTNALTYFLERAKHQKPKLNQFLKTAICTVGDKTRQQAESLGLKVDLVPRINSKEGIIQALGEIGIKGKRVLIPCGNLSKAELAFGLMQKGARVDSVVVYETQTPNHHDITQIAKLLFHGNIPVLTFTSPSAFQNFIDLFDHRDYFVRHRKIIIAAIGETTAAFIRENGYPVHVVPEKPEISMLVNSIKKYMEINSTDQDQQI